AKNPEAFYRSFLQRKGLSYDDCRKGFDIFRKTGPLSVLAASLTPAITAMEKGNFVDAARHFREAKGELERLSKNMPSALSDVPLSSIKAQSDVLSFAAKASDALAVGDSRTMKALLNEAEGFSPSGGFFGDLVEYLRLKMKATVAEIESREIRLRNEYRSRLMNSLTFSFEPFIEAQEGRGELVVRNDFATSLDLSISFESRDIEIKPPNISFSGLGKGETFRKTVSLSSAVPGEHDILISVEANADGIPLRVEKSVTVTVEEHPARKKLPECITLDVPELIEDVEAPLKITVENTVASSLRVSVDLSGNEFLNLKTSSLKFPRLKKGNRISKTLSVIPKYAGDFDLTVSISAVADGLSIEGQKVVPVRVREKVVTPVATPVSTPSPSTAPLLFNPIEALAEFYQDFEFIGEGGFAKVFKAKRKKDGKTVALKIPKTMDPAVGKAFIREVSNWLHLKHPNIVELYDVNIYPVPYLEMEYCEGALDRLQKPLPVEEASLLIFNITEGLKYAHSKGVVHRDLKPNNILLKNGIPKISDWGLSKVMEASLNTTSSTTTSFTPYYAAPEQLDRKFGKTDEKTDIWQLGVIFYELVTGKRPFEGSLSEVISTIMRRDPIPPTKLNSSTRKVEPIIMKMLEKRKGKRYKNIDELQRDLARVLNITYSESLEKSKTLGDSRRAVYYLTELLLINMRVNNAKDAYKYAMDLMAYTKGNLREETENLAEQIASRLEARLGLPPELIERAEVLVHEIRMQFGS
ncbi:serine/threonine-protein kinase, partial [Thermococcus sp.]|uniref:serine/threonine-protein kinase n=1 Tax=Thermococcus sp. TaxID=35749 RepID=UPI0026319C27